jgi:MFS family permease
LHGERIYNSNRRAGRRSRPETILVLKPPELVYILSTMSERKTIFALGWVSFFMDVSSEMVYPLLPIFLASLGAGGTAIGFIAGLSEMTASLFRVVSGFLSDRLKKRKAAVLFGYGLSTLARPLLALSSTWAHVLGFRLIDRAGKGVRTPPRDALIAEASSVERYGRSFGLQRAMDTAGAVLGPALATLILARGMGYRTVFWISFVPAAIAVAIIQIFVRERTKRAPEPVASERAAPGAGLLSRDLKIFLLVTAIFSLGNSSSFFLILRAKNLGLEASLIPVLYMTMNASYALLSYPAGGLADRFGKAKIAFIGYLLYAALYALFAVEADVGTLWILFPLQGIYLAFTDGVGSAYLATLLPGPRKATGFAIYYTVISLALLPASTIGGWLWDRFSPSATFVAGSLLSLVAGTIFGVALLRGSRRKGA